MLRTKEDHQVVAAPCNNVANMLSENVVCDQAQKRKKEIIVLTLDRVIKVLETSKINRIKEIRKKKI